MTPSSPTAPPQADAIVDTVGGETIQKLLNKVKPGGTIGSVLGEPPGARGRGLAVRAHRAHPDSYDLRRWLRPSLRASSPSPLRSVCPCRRSVRAHTLAEQGASGKIVLRIR